MRNNKDTPWAGSLRDGLFWRRTVSLSPRGASGPEDEAPADSSTVFSTDVKVVNVLATVRTKGGEIVADLNKEDFLLAEDNRPQVIRYFSRETNLPLVLGLLVDTSRSQTPVLGDEESASYRFLDDVLREDLDKAFLANFDFNTRLLQGMTSSREKLRLALAGLECRLVEFQTCSRVDVPVLGHREGGSAPYRGNTTLFDAVYLASSEVMRHQEGRKAAVLLTDGVDHGSSETIESAIEQAQRADTLVYSILFAGKEGSGRGVLQKMSRETGGGYFEVSRERSIDVIYRRIEEELRSQY
ncbi:MAG TPA: VWA domain-containing protein, partial [Bryobacteraceae bacterium]|nr:VWA domain-containing protein [Bryobacteraceae bacterium]